MVAHDDAGGLLPIKRTIRVIDAQNQTFREQEVNLPTGSRVEVCYSKAGRPGNLLTSPALSPPFPGLPCNPRSSRPGCSLCPALSFEERPGGRWVLTQLARGCAGRVGSFGRGGGKPAVRPPAFRDCRANAGAKNVLSEQVCAFKPARFSPLAITLFFYYLIRFLRPRSLPLLHATNFFSYADEWTFKVRIKVSIFYFLGDGRLEVALYDFCQTWVFVLPPPFFFLLFVKKENFCKTLPPGFLSPPRLLFLFLKFRNGLFF